jgi:pimeloyl-ACP methyl ester carboxylesterase
MTTHVSVVLAHGAWADGSSWAQVITPLLAAGHKVLAAPLPLTSLDADVAALDRTLERVPGPIVLVAHAYAGAVIAATRNERVKGLVYITALAPDQGETVADVFYRAAPHPRAPKLAPPSSRPCSQRCSDPLIAPVSALPSRGRGGVSCRLGSWSPNRTT